MQTVTTIIPCIWLDDSAEAAASFYTQTFPAGRVVGVSRYPESIDNPGGKPRGSVLTVEFEIAGSRFTALNGGPLFRLNPSISFFVHVETAAEAVEIYGRLAEGGEPLMPLGSYPWSERYGWIQDRFGVSWQVITGRRPPGGANLVPCLMFAGAQHGRAAEALRGYAGVFPDGRVDHLETYAPGEGPVDTVKHGRARLAGAELIAMDSHVEHGFTFNEALSLQVACRDQEEIDRLWDGLADGGEPGPCGWLKDRFGVSWQIVPSAVWRWMTSDDAAARDRAFAAMMMMGKLDLAALERAFAGE